MIPGWLRRALLGLLVLALLTPLGLLASEPAWGEWGWREIAARLGWVPRGLKRLAGLWRAPLGGYGLPGLSGPVGYVLSALVGALVVAVAAWAMTASVGRKR